MPCHARHGCKRSEAGRDTRRGETRRADETWKTRVRLRPPGWAHLPLVGVSLRRSLTSM